MGIEIFPDNTASRAAYFQASAPPSPVAGDVWVDSSSTTETYDLANYYYKGTDATGFRNILINGAMEVSQRGTTFNNIGNATYCLDRYSFGKDGTATANVTQQTMTPGTFSPEFSNYLRLEVSSWTSGSTFIRANVENVRLLSGTLTLSYYAKASTTVTNTPLWVTNFGSGGSAGTFGYLPTTATITTSWQRFTHAFTADSLSGKTIGTGNYFGIDVLRFGQAATVEITGVQLERGSVATPFEIRPVQQELALCQRYYQRYNYPITDQPTGATGVILSSTTAITTFLFPVIFRTTPTLLSSSGSWNIVTTAGISVTGQPTIFNASPHAAQLNCTVSGATGGHGCFLRAGGNGTNYLEFGAEL